MDDSTLSAAGVLDGVELEVKDLGPQISWITVFMIEYVRMFYLCDQSLCCAHHVPLATQIGPLIIHPLMYHFPRVFYGGPVQHSQLQSYVPIWCVMAVSILD